MKKLFSMLCVAGLMLAAPACCWQCCKEECPEKECKKECPKKERCCREKKCCNDGEKEMY